MYRVLERRGDRTVGDLDEVGRRTWRGAARDRAVRVRSRVLVPVANPAALISRIVAAIVATPLVINPEAVG